MPSVRSILICLCLALPAPGWAQTDRTDQVITGLEADGFTVVEVRRSWLGRIIITAEDGSGLREVVLNRSSGEILRDRVFGGGAADRGDRPSPKGDRPKGGGPAGGQGGGPGNGPGGGPGGGGGGGGQGGGGGGGP